MKNLYLHIVTPVVILLSAFGFQNSFVDIVNAMKAGNSSQLAKHFDNYVEISLPEKSNSYSKSQAEIIMKDFFSAVGVKGFEVKHKGENGGAQFCIGILQTKNRNYRTTLFLKQKGNKQVLQEIRVEGGENAGRLEPTGF
ncbi:MAG TPA: DUF4783 domain-containing protein [Parasegetibacter sp.]